MGVIIIFCYHVDKTNYFKFVFLISIDTYKCALKIAIKLKET